MISEDLKILNDKLESLLKTHSNDSKVVQDVIADIKQEIQKKKLIKYINKAIDFKLKSLLRQNESK